MHGGSWFPSSVKGKTAQKNFKRECAKYVLIDEQNGSYSLGREVPNLFGAMDVLTVPTTEQELVDALYSVHCSVASGNHEGRDGMQRKVALLMSYRGWSSLFAGVLTSCAVCLASRGRRVVPPLQVMLFDRPMEAVFFDFFDMPPFQGTGNRHILVVVDHFSKFVWAKAFPNKDSLTVLQYLKSIFDVFGFPEALFSDNAKEFNSKILLVYLDHYAKSAKRSGRPYHPQSQGVVERTNRKLAESLVARVTASVEKNWEAHLDETVRVLNFTPHTTTGVPPFTVCAFAPLWLLDCRG